MIAQYGALQPKQGQTDHLSKDVWLLRYCSSMDILDQIKFDAFYEAEKITGKSYKTDEATSNLGLALSRKHAKQTKEILAHIGDTHFQSKWQDFLLILEGEEFEILYRQTNGVDEHIIAYHPEHMLLSADSYTSLDKQNLNAVKLYFNREVEEDIRWSLELSGGFHQESLAKGVKILSGDLQGVEAFRTKFRKLLANSSVVFPWIECPLLHLEAHWESRKQELDFETRMEQLARNNYQRLLDCGLIPADFAL